MKFALFFPQIFIFLAGFLLQVFAHFYELLVIPVVLQAVPLTALLCLIIVSFMITLSLLANLNFCPFFGAFILSLTRKTLLTAPSREAYFLLSFFQRQT